MKKGVVQLQESILVTFFIIIIIIIGIIVFYRFSLNSVNNYENEYREQELLSMLMTLPNELGHTYLGESQNAIDTSKLFYNELGYGFKRIVVEQTYPEQERVECTMQNYPKCNYFVVYNKANQRLNRLIESRPVSLYYPLTDEYNIGKLIVEYYY
jgi:hypothetical protein